MISNFMRGYVEGYEASKVDIQMEAVSECTGTAEGGQE